MSLLDAAVEEFQSRFFSVADGLPGPRDAYGNPYVVIALGVKDEGEHSPYLATTEELAVQGWLDAAMKYSNQNAGSVLFWRTRPEVHCQNFRECKENGDVVPLPSDVKSAFIRQLWTVYSRLSIGNPR